MPKQIKPTICTSLTCSDRPKNHCKECSHAIYERIVICDGKKYKMHFQPRFGPLFTRANQTKNEPDWTPGCRHKLWKAAGPAMNRICNQKDEVTKT
jgi:hypothetical protein